MQKKKKYSCSVCNTQWECYVYDEFTTPFSVCLYCLMDIESAFRKNAPAVETCALCDTSKECHKIAITNNPVKSDMYMCNDCFTMIKELMKK